MPMAAKAFFLPRTMRETTATRVESTPPLKAVMMLWCCWMARTNAFRRWSFRASRAGASLYAVLFFVFLYMGLGSLSYL